MRRDHEDTHPLRVEPLTLTHLVRLENELRRVIRSSDQAVRMTLTALLADGHVLIEDVPGVGKTTLAHAVARTLDGSFQRIQFTSDLLPSDVVGTNIYSQRAERFEFKHGPIFANVVLADEINRTTPKTQSALLEAMNEHQVTVDTESHPLPRPFLVIATQNPSEHHGTFPLPESQLDRFLVRIRMGYPHREDELAILRGQAGAEQLSGLQPLLSTDNVLELQQMTREVHVDDSLLEYELALAGATRHHDSLAIGVSPRGTLMLHRAAQARALLEGRTYCTPSDIKDMVVPVFSHRVLVQPRLGAGLQRPEQIEALIAAIRDTVPVPE